jgi:hypothetical protein
MLNDTKNNWKNRDMEHHQNPSHEPAKKEYAGALHQHDFIPPHGDNDHGHHQHGGMIADFKKRFIVVFNPGSSYHAAIGK